jgi:HAD superfamily hydrolase (TIGR01509 family)
VLRPSLVIFDCDGVLVDSEHLTHRVLHEMLLAQDVDITYDDTILLFMGSSSVAFLEKVSGLCGGQVPPDFLERFRTGMAVAFAESLTAVNGIEELLSVLPMDYCVASNGRHAKMRLTLGKTGLLPRFENRIFSAEDVAHPKPAPDLFLHAAKTLGVAPAHCLVIEDSPTGVRGARAAGMRVLGYVAMASADALLEAGAHEVFDDMADVPRLLGLVGPPGLEPGTKGFA